jgi:SAM-dependent methyltransferase
VTLESVLEHVDSPGRSLSEVCRVLAPGGVAFVTTTNRWAIGVRNAEFNVPFYPFLPSVVKESFVFFHLHHRPSLANYTERPAVHWYSFSDLCRIGRQAGFGLFYSHVDLKDVDTAVVGGPRARLKRALIRGAQASPWVRALALTQVGGTIFMVKRDASGSGDEEAVARPDGTAAPS